MLVKYRETQAYVKYNIHDVKYVIFFYFKQT